MHVPEYDTVVRSAAGRPELRRVSEVQEWRIEQELVSGRLVLSVVTTGGDARSFLVAQTDAQDIGAVLQRRAGAPED